MLKRWARLHSMAETSRRTKLLVWGIVLALFAGAAWFTVSTLRASVQPFGVISDPFPAEEQRPEGSTQRRGAVNFLVFGEISSTNHTLSIFHLAEGRRRIDVLNFPADSTAVTDIQDIPGTLVEIEELTGARMEHVMRWDLGFLTQLESSPIQRFEELAANPEVLNADDVWTTALQEALSISDPGQLRTLASSMTPYIDADEHLDTGRITELAKSLRHVAPSSVETCLLPAQLSDEQRNRLVNFFRPETTGRCEQYLLGQGQ